MNAVMRVASAASIIFPPWIEIGIEQKYMPVVPDNEYIPDLEVEL